MKRKFANFGWTPSSAILALMLAAGTFAVAQTETVLYNFGNPYATGTFPASGLIADAAGNLYGATQQGGTGRGAACLPTHSCGIVFELSPQGGSWVETILHVFNDNGADGYFPESRLVFDSAGNLYGTTLSGGTYNSGTVFKLTPKTGGGFTEKVVHSFGNSSDGVNPQGLIIDSSGNLYGTTQSGGFFGAGEVYELKRNSTGLIEKALLSFNKKGKGGYLPGPENLVRDSSGNFFGTTEQGGALANGTVYELTPKTGGGYIETVLYPTNNRATGVIMDGSGNLFGEMPYAGTGNGAVFELSPGLGGTWTEQTLYTFCSTGSCGTDGSVPTGGLIFDNSGNLYGTTYYGGAYGTSGQGFGTMFKLTQSAGTWTEGTVYSFGNGADGANPQGGLLLDGGTLYGITQNGGLGFGTAFQVVP